jgi:hypothetical protein
MPGDSLESEPNDTSGTAQLVPLTHPLTAFAGVKLDDPERLTSLRTDAPFTAFDWFRVDAADDLQVAIVVVPPERGALLALDGALLDAWRAKKSQSSPKHPAPAPPNSQTVRNVVSLIELKPLEGQAGRRLRVMPGDDTLPGASYQIAAATSGEHGLAGLLDLAAQLGEANRSTAQRGVLEWGLKVFERTSPDAHRLKEALNQLP